MFSLLIVPCVVTVRFKRRTRQETMRNRVTDTHERRAFQRQYCDPGQRGMSKRRGRRQRRQRRVSRRAFVGRTTNYRKVISFKSVYGTPMEFGVSRRSFIDLQLLFIAVACN